MAALATQQLAGGAALTPSYSAASAGGDTATPGDKTFLVVKNAAGSPVTVTLDTKPDQSPWGTTIPDQTVSVPATNGERWIGPLTGSMYGSTVNITYSSATSVTVGVFTL